MRGASPEGTTWDTVADNVIPFRESAPLALDEAESARLAQMDQADPEDLPAVEMAPLPGVASPSDWKGRSPPEREFIIPGWIVRGHAGLLSGMEGVGKSLIVQQMLTCAAAGKPFLGMDIAPVKAVYITCEDDIDELWRRQESINKSLGITMEDLEGRLLLVSLLGEMGNELGTFDSAGRFSLSDRYRQIEVQLLDFGAELAAVDNAAHFFTGNENARHDVASFLAALERLSILINGAVLLLAHPNKQHSQGNKQGNEYSGSTGWSAHVRNRLFLDYREDPEDGTPIDDDDRVLRKSKANYGKRGEEVFFRWQDWAFVRMEDMPADRAREIAANVQASVENDRFYECLDKATQERRAVSASSAASSYAPRVFAKMPAARGMKKEAFEAAMNRLLGIGMIIAEQKVFQRPNRVWVTGIAMAEGCTNPRTNHARSGAPTMHEARTNPSTNPHSTHPPSTTYIGEPLEGPQSMYDGSDVSEPPEWMNTPLDESESWRANPILNPDYEP